MVIAIAALVVSIAGTLGAVWYTRRSAQAAEAAAAAAEKSAAAAEKAAAAAEKTAVLDAERRHAELTPEFEIACTAEHNGISDHGELTVTFTGPDGLDRLDEVTIVILDESGADHWGRGYPTGVSEEEARRFVWGPWEFNTGASAQVTGNRTTVPRPYSWADGRNWDRLSLARTHPGHWMSMDQERWQKQVDGPVRLQITARRGSEQWTLLREVEPRT
jgi:hypothetical protein